MFDVRKIFTNIRPAVGVTSLLLALLLPLPFTANAGSSKKKKNDATASKTPPKIDYSNIVWPNPPAIARIRYLAFYSAQPLKDMDAPKTAKQGWMDRLAGTVPASENSKPFWQLAQPYGLAIDSKGRVYVADTRVGAIFI